MFDRTSVANDAFYFLPAGISGWGHVYVGDNDAYAHFSYDNLGNVTLWDNTANVTSTQGTAASFNIHRNAVSSRVELENKLGSAQNIVLQVVYQ